MSKNSNSSDQLTAGIKNPCFGLLSTDEKEYVNQAKTEKTLKSGHELFGEDATLKGVYCVNKGKVKIYKLGNDGKEQIIDIAKESALLGFRTMLAENPSKVTAETLEECSITFIPRECFMSLLSSNSKFQGALLKLACQELGVLTDSITNYAQQPVRERLAGMLLVLMGTYKKEEQDPDTVEINLSREDLANIIGTATETTIRILREFKKKELINIKGRKITILNSHELMKIADTQ